MATPHASKTKEGMQFETLDLERSGAVARVTLDRPDAANALNGQMMSDLLDVSIALDEDPTVRAVVLTGRGPMFCAGGDLAEFSRAGDTLPALLKKLTTIFHGAVARFARMDAPLITAINGTAAGAGFSLAVAGEYAMAAESARFTMAYTNAGLTPDGSSTFFISRLAGLRRAQELMITNRLLSAREAVDWCLVNEVVPDDRLQDEAMALAERLASGPTRAFGSVKRLLLQSAGDALESQMEAEARAIADAARSADGREGIAAFLAKRKPSFTGN